MDDAVDNDPERGNHLFFSTKDTIRLVYSCVDTIVLVFGLSLNLLLIYLIQTKTVSAMNVYKKLLLMSCSMDLLVSFWTFITQPIPCVDHGYRTVIMNGLFRNTSQEIRYAVYLIWIQLMLFFLITTMSQYVYRYCILCRNGAMPPAIFWTLAAVMVFLNIFHACVLAWADYPRPEDAGRMVELRSQIQREAGITDINFISFVNAQALPWWTHNVIMCVIIPSFYFVIVKCSVQIRRAVNEMNVLKIREYNMQVSAALFFQALLPTFEMCAWCVQMFVPLFMVRESSVMVVVFSDIPIHLVPVLNPLGTILFVAPYRRAVFRYLGISQASSTLVHLRSRIIQYSNYNRSKILPVEMVDTAIEVIPQPPPIAVIKEATSADQFSYYIQQAIHQHGDADNNSSTYF